MCTGVVNKHVPELWGYVFFSDGILNDISCPKDASLLQWMYMHYCKIHSRAKKGLHPYKYKQRNFKEKVRIEKLILNDILYWKIKTPIKFVRMGS